MSEKKFRVANAGQAARLDAKSIQDAKDLAGHLRDQEEIDSERAKGDSPWLWMQDKANKGQIWMNEYPESVEKMNELFPKKK